MNSAGVFTRRMNIKLLVLMGVVLMFLWPNRLLTASQSLPEILSDFAPSGWHTYDEIKQFTPENLYEQINGRASFFLAYDMVRMTFVSFVNSANAQHFIDLSIYDMGTTINAFGVFSTERSPGETSIDIGRSGYFSGANYFIWKGRYYIRIISSEASEVAQKIGINIARDVTKILPESDEQPWGMTALPLKDLITSSIQYAKVDAMGLDFMNDTYLAEYRKGGTNVMTFLSRRDSVESAKDIVDQYATFAKKYGRSIARQSVGGVELVSCDMGGSYDVIFHKDNLIGGVGSVEDQNLAIRVAIELWEQLRSE